MSDSLVTKGEGLVGLQSLMVIAILNLFLGQDHCSLNIFVLYR